MQMMRNARYDTLAGWLTEKREKSVRRDCVRGLAIGSKSFKVKGIIAAMIERERTCYRSLHFSIT
jgi:hypothetical protein